MTQSLPKTDVLIVGLGVAGGIASHVLTKAGLNVVALEAGPWRTKADFLKYYDELQGYPYHNPFADVKANKEIPTWRPDEKTPVGPLPVGPIVMDNHVGGTLHWTGQAWRYRVDDFKIRSTTIDKYGEDALPEGSNVADWPVTYEELEPYYEMTEQFVGISGDGGTNPFESPRKNDYPMPGLRRSGLGEFAADGLAKAGLHPFTCPAGITSVDYNGRPACSYCGYCTGHGCWNDSKASTLVSAIPAAQETGKLEVRANSRVTKILTNDKGQTTGVTYIDENGKEQEQQAGVVILSTYVYENVRMLLLSTSSFFKNGLGNNSGNVGKWYMAHSYGGAYGLFPGQNFNILSGTASQSIAVDDFNGDNFDHTGLGFIRGAICNVSQGESTPIGRSGMLPPGQAGWGSSYKKFLKESANSIVSFSTQLEVLPYDANFLDLDPTAKDDLGMPIIRLTFNLYDNEKTANTYINGKLEDALKAMGASQTWSYPDPANIPVNSHAYGGTRMGEDPAVSVTNKYGQVHESPNLVVLGGSNWCSTTGYNPTETIYTHSWFAADYLAKNFSKIAI
jgi:gluconate 2-dehydrogenase alpha chain